MTSAFTASLAVSAGAAGCCGCHGSALLELSVMTSVSRHVIFLYRRLSCSIRQLLGWARECDGRGWGFDTKRGKKTLKKICTDIKGCFSLACLSLTRCFEMLLLPYPSTLGSQLRRLKIICKHGRVKIFNTKMSARSLVVRTPFR